MPTFSNTKINKTSPLNILTNNIYYLTLNTTIYDELPITNVTIDTDSPILLKFDNSLVNMNNNGEYIFDIKLTSNDYSLGSYSINFIIKATNELDSTTTETFNFQVIVSKYILNEAPCYININANINNSLQLVDNNIELPTKTINHVNPNFNAEYNFPIGSINIDTGIIKIKSPNGNILGNFFSYLNISANKNGLLNANIEITGDPISVNIIDDQHTAQSIYWPDEIILPNSESSDILESTITISKLKNILASQINQIENIYNLNLITSWTMKIDKITNNGLPNVIDKYAYDFNRQYPFIFNEGEFITLETKFNYSVQIEDLNGDIKNIVPNTPVFAKITQNNNSPVII